ncbi:hypothetical protein EYC80_005584 [Monilinia laxa]|uniref:Heterokaryon incompatibility domain-containing protein n=1 Tax=Monilinia laxa TaxID=61186 RepID=A0A5N6KEC2_MONLA|nr:hypothetical protein EYC80_005584 [Monilinia laxa]
MFGCFPKFFHSPSNNSTKSTSPPNNSPEGTQQFSTLCKTCTKIFDIAALKVEKADNKQDGKLKVWRRKCRYKAFISYLEFNSSNGCELCTLLLEFKLRDNGWVDGYWRHEDWKKNPLDDNFKVKVEWNVFTSELNFEFRLSSRFHFYQDENNVLPKRLNIQRELDFNMSSTSNLSLAKEWLKDCTESHQGCRIKIENGILPTRLLEIPSSDLERLRLCETRRKEINGYVCLSYCWGQAGPHITSSTNISSRLNNIDSNELPLTIRDAITITQNLGFKYIWIDSLCIIQDSAKDIDIELAKMTEIYKNSQLTIIAASAKDTNEGFLGSIPVPEILIRVPLDINHLKSGTVHLRECNFEARVEPDPTETRAWCLQESVLSPRCLVYSYPHLYWSCYDVHYKVRDSYLGRIPSKKVIRFPNLSTEDDNSRTTGVLDTYSFWTTIMKQYSSRFITFEKDRFRALSALAREFHTVTGNTYAAGHWVESLNSSLLWHPSKQQFTPKTLIVPTWSWLSYSNPVQIEPLEWHRLGMEIISVQCDLENPEEPFGSIRGGTIELRGRLKEVFFWSDKFHDKWSNPQNPSHNGHWICTHRDQRINEEYNDNWATAFLDYTTMEKGKSWDDFQRGSEANLWALSSFWWERHPPKKDYHWHGLLLEETGEKNVFKRVGVFQNDGSLMSQCPWFEDVELTTLKLI